MIQKQDLRIGNWISDVHASDTGMWQVTELKRHQCAYGKSLMSKYENLKPIPLTPEILEKYGFSCNINDNEFIYNNHCEITLKVTDGKYWSCYEIKMDGFKYIEYLHQLQNLIFALTGEELTTTL